MTLAYATHRLSGVVSPANAAYSAAELEFQLKDSGARALFTVSYSRLLPNTIADCLVCSTSRNCPEGSKVLRNPERAYLPARNGQGVLR